MDRITSAQRSAQMSLVKSKNTGPELIVRKLAHSLGYRYRLHGAGLPGKPDLVFAKRKKVVFVHGCFWHGHSCYLFRLPKTRTDFWQAKIDANRKRDIRQLGLLQEAGWHVETVWECELRNLSTDQRAEVIMGLGKRIRTKGKKDHARQSGPDVEKRRS